jgi:hypothetical protein
MGKSLLSRKLMFVTLSAILLGSTGCDYTKVVWLPDSSGFCYTTPKRELVRFDVATGKRQVLVADTRTLTTLPALSPDGTRLGIARLYGSGDTDRLDIVVYDLRGKELYRSQELVWRKRPQYYERDEGHTVLLWGPKGKDDRLAVFEFGAGHDCGLYDLKTKRLVVSTDRPFALRPDFEGFLISSHDCDPKTIAFVDSKGKKHPIAMKKGQLEKIAREYAEVEISRRVADDWEGNTFSARLGQHVVSIDTTKMVGVFEYKPLVGNAKPGPGVQAKYAFPDTKLIVRVMYDRPFSQLEVMRPDEKKPTVVLASTKKLVSLNPAPNNKRISLARQPVRRDGLL